jgi:hypothetical protein
MRAGIFPAGSFTVLQSGNMKKIFLYFSICIFSFSAAGCGGDGVITPPGPDEGGKTENNIRFEAPSTFPAGKGPKSVRMADFDGDGIVDLVTANNDSGNISILRGRGDGTFGKPSNFPALISMATG